MVARESWGLEAQFESDIFYHKNNLSNLLTNSKTCAIITALQKKQYKINLVNFVLSTLFKSKQGGLCL